MKKNLTNIYIKFIIMEIIEEDTWVCLEDNRNESKIVKVNEKKY